MCIRDRQTIAANLGSMLTPIGNPQNLYLFSAYGMSFAEFMRTTVPVTLVSALLLILVICMSGSKELEVGLPKRRPEAEIKMCIRDRLWPSMNIWTGRASICFRAAI